jgi:membrane fusion protein
VLLAPRLSHRLFAGVAAAAIVVMTLLLAFGHYTRHARVSGWLVPDRGLLQVFAPQSGLITEVAVKEGQSVMKGDRLLSISAELHSASLGDTRGEIVRRLRERRDSLVAQREELDRLSKQQATSIAARIAALKAEEHQLAAETDGQRQRFELASTSEKRQRQLFRGNYISQEQLQTAEDGRLDQQSKLQALTRTRLTTERERLSLEGELADLPFKTKTTLADLERSIASIEQELASAEAQREIVVQAPEDGVVTAVQAVRGSRPNPNVPLFSILPTGARLEANLYCPSRAAGFLRTGQKVMLRYQAYPYQKFGHGEGELQELSRSALSPTELPAQLQGMTSITGTAEPVYRITVSLNRQTIRAYGVNVPLQPGMLLEADILVETRRLYEWILDPLFTVTGKWGS